MVGQNEKIFWRAKPNKVCFLLEAIFNKLLPFAIIWAAFDIFFLVGILNGEVSLKSDLVKDFPIIFLIFHALPVWIYLAGVLLASRKYRNSEYIITDKCVYISDGIINYSCHAIPYFTIARLSIKKGFFDRYLGVGDIQLFGDFLEDESKQKNFVEICDIPDYREVFEMVKSFKEKA